MELSSLPQKLSKATFLTVCSFFALSYSLFIEYPQLAEQ
jgi:hypothetical protein